MKNTSKKVLSCLLAMLIVAGMVLLSGCQNGLIQKEPLVIKDSETCIVIKVTGESLGDKTDLLLIDYMETLKEAGELEFKVENGMITSINGIDNPVDFTSCWMLYTSDEALSNTAWGIVEYDGKQYGSAVVGAEKLTVKADQLYIWVYQSFS